MRRGYRVTLGILTIMILITMTIGTSYSFYSVSDVQDESNNLTATCFEVDFVEDENDINLTSAYPMTEDTASEKVTPHTFTVTNKCTSANSVESIKYKVILATTTDSNDTLLGHIRYKLGTSENDTSAKSGALTGDAGASKYEIPADVKSKYSLKQGYELGTGTLSFEEDQQYYLRLWIDDKAGNDIMGLNFKGKILIYADI